MTDTSYQALVVGAGPAGLASAASLAREGVKTALLARAKDLAPETMRADPRTIALMQPSIMLLRHLQVFPKPLQKTSCPLNRLRIIDDTGNTFRAPDMVFHANELGEEPFGWNIPLADLTPALHDQTTSNGVTMLRGEAAMFNCKADRAFVKTTSGDTISAQVVIAADGRDSVLRKQAGITAHMKNFNQVALVTTFAHSSPHNETSSEIHKPFGLLTTVPMPGQRSALVWMVPPERGAELCDMPDTEFCRNLQRETKGELGVISDVKKRSSFPMRHMTVQKFARNRLLLVGESGHVVTPIGAQGLNMSLRDAGFAAELIGAACAFDDDPGAAKIITDYDAARRRDILPRQTIIHAMNQSLLSRFAPLHALRAIGLGVAGSVAPIRRQVMAMGLAPTGDLPRSMRI